MKKLLPLVLLLLLFGCHKKQFEKKSIVVVLPNNAVIIEDDVAMTPEELREAEAYWRSCQEEGSPVFEKQSVEDYLASLNNNSSIKEQPKKIVKIKKTAVRKSAVKKSAPAPEPEYIMTAQEIAEAEAYWKTCQPKTLTASEIVRIIILFLLIIIGLIFIYKKYSKGR